MRKILKNFKISDIIMLTLSVGFIVLQVWLELKLPEYMMEITTLLKTQNTAIKDIWGQGVLMILCSLLSALSAIMVSYFIAKVSAGFSMRLRLNIFSHIQSYSLEQIKKFSTASLITRTTNDVMQVQMLLSFGVQVIIKAPVTAIWTLSKMSSTNWQCSIATAIAVTILLATIATCISLSLPKFKKMQTLTDNINNVARENLQGSRVVRAYNAEDYEKNKFEKANQELTKTGLFTSRIMNILSPVMTLIMSCLTLSIYFIGAVLISKANISTRIPLFGEIMGFSSYAMQVVMSFMLMSTIFILLPRSSVSLKRIADVLNTKSSISDGNYNQTNEIKGKVEFKNVSFKYPDAEEYVLKDINFCVNQGETIAFIGSTGSGKSTLINLVPRFYDCSEGNIYIDDIDIKDYNLHLLRNKMGYISQKPIIFSGSITENVCFGDNGNPKPSKNEVNSALSTSCALNFVSKMNDKENSIISQGGTNISGGQKQRLSIARAIARKPEILIFDDSFSALDYKTDKKLRKSLEQKLPNVTKLIVAQRIGTIKNADKIIVLDQGEVVGNGTHIELLNNCSVYKEIALSQFSQEEIENELRK